jgi:bifunctional DNA-binding transcriptional regulator/antitoxin component of YhaV-PrlF toxin-antitoxin module
MTFDIRVFKIRGGLQVEFFADGDSILSKRCKDKKTLEEFKSFLTECIINFCED